MLSAADGSIVSTKGVGHMARNDRWDAVNSEQKTGDRETISPWGMFSLIFTGFHPNLLLPIDPGGGSAPISMSFRPLYTEVASEALTSYFVKSICHVRKETVFILS